MSHPSVHRNTASGSRWIRLASLLSSMAIAPWSSTGIAGQVAVAVKVLDDEDQPVHGAGIVVGLDVCSSLVERISTDANGLARLTLQVPDEGTTHGRVIVGYGRRDGESDRDLLLRWRGLTKQFQFPGLGTPFQILPGQTQVDVTVQACSTITIAGRVQSGLSQDAAMIIGESGSPAEIVRSDDLGWFQILVARNAPLLTVTTEQWTRLLAVEAPEGQESVDLGVVQFAEPTGYVAGVATSGGAPARGESFTFVRVSGDVLLSFVTDENGFFVAGLDSPGDDPLRPEGGIQLPAGRYVLMSVPHDLWLPEDFAIRHVAVNGGESPEFRGLPQIQIDPGGRATIRVDADEVRALSAAAIRAAF